MSTHAREAFNSSRARLWQESAAFAASIPRAPECSARGPAAPAPALVLRELLTRPIDIALVNAIHQYDFVMRQT